MPLLFFFFSFIGSTFFPFLLNTELKYVWRLPPPLLPMGLALIFPIISMSNDTKGMEPILRALYTFPFLQNKKEPNQTHCNI